MNSTKYKKMHTFINIPPESHFPIQNLPYGVFKPKSGGNARVGVAIGDMVLTLSTLQDAGLMRTTSLDIGNVFSQSSLNQFFSLGREAWAEVRSLIQNLLQADNPVLRDNDRLRSLALLPIKDVEMLLPVSIGDYTDFYSSKEHATNVGMMFRGKDHALQPNWVHLPVAYHGRSSSIVVSGTDIRRPKGQIKNADRSFPDYAASRLLDFELEMGFFIGTGNPIGDPIPIEKAMDHIFGMVLVNDWSARDIQRWEYVPLGPFLGKNFATSISPWVVTMEALEPFIGTGPQQDPEPLPYLKIDRNWTYDIHLEVTLQSERMEMPCRICRTNFKYIYWNINQQIAHHTINGCNLRSGDLLATGTVSGPQPESFGSMLELAWQGTKPIQFPNGETRKYIEDGDRITMTGWCQGDGYRVGFGELTGKILPTLK